MISITHSLVWSPSRSHHHEPNRRHLRAAGAGSHHHTKHRRLVTMNQKSIEQRLAALESQQRKQVIVVQYPGETDEEALKKCGISEDHSGIDIVRIMVKYDG